MTRPGDGGPDERAAERAAAAMHPLADSDPRLRAAIQATRAGETGTLWQIAGTAGPGARAARKALLAQAIEAAASVTP